MSILKSLKPNNIDCLTNSKSKDKANDNLDLNKNCTDEINANLNKDDNLKED